MTHAVVIGLDPDTAIERTVVRLTPDGRMSRTDAARYIGVQPKTLAKWGMTGRGPQSLKIGARCFYTKVELDRFITQGK